MKRSATKLLSLGAAALLAAGAATAQVVIQDRPVAAEPVFPGAAPIQPGGKELRAAQAARKHNRLSLAPEPYEANALLRCTVHTTAEARAACHARMLGMGQIEGSVAGGGLLRSVETVVLPEGQTSVTVIPQTADPVVLVPSTATMGAR